MRINLTIVFLLFAAVGNAAITPPISDPLDSWTLKESTSKDSIYGIAYGNGRFVGFGSGYIFTSQNGENWASKSHPNVSSIAFGNNLFVVINSGYPNSLSTSSNGTDWAVQSAPPAALNSIAFGNGLFVAVGQDKILTSPDGTNWTTHPSGTMVDLWDVTYGGGTYLAGGGNIVTGALLARSTDAMNWTLLKLDPNIFWFLQGLTYGNGRFVGVSQAIQIISSADGINWNVDSFSDYAGFYSVAYGSGTYVAVGKKGVIQTSPDGSTWKLRNSGTTQILFGICYGADRFVAVGNGGVILESDPFVTYRGPVVTTEPTDQIALVGGPAAFTAKVTGDVPFSFAWQKDGVTILGATNADLILNDIQAADAGTYSVTISNSIGTTNSTPAILTVKDVKVLANGEVIAGSSFTASVTANVAILSKFKNGNIFYTLDGTEPDFNSTPFSSSFDLLESRLLRVIAYSADFSESVNAGPINVTIIGNYSLYRTTRGGGSITVDPPGFDFASNTVVNLAALPLPGWTFMGWTGAVTGTDATNQVLMNREKHVEALFGTSIQTTVAGKGKVSLFPSVPIRSDDNGRQACR